MKTCILALLAFIAFSTSTFAESKDGGGEKVHVLIEPVIGYQVLKFTYPYEHHQGMLTYGGRVVVGTYTLAGEFEMEYGSVEENFLSPNIKNNTSLLQTRLGPRMIFPLLDEVHLVTRAGMQGYKYSSDTLDNVSGGITSSSQSWQFRPYLGAGFLFYFFDALSLSVEETYVVDTSWETSFGFRLFI
jgi:hypothetical protein